MNATCLIIYVSMSGLDLNGKIAVSFGSSDSSYEHWGRAVDTLTYKLAKLGAVVLDGLKIDLAPTYSEKEQSIQFGQSFVERMGGISLK
ncbi:hypothetical protein QUF88_26660 [Bacillus sp. DX1.1]|uniref:flavodoxin domain-containing protein n=1 Tax=unclassified Bacillus (in: firmicutes) TaxID=185979 RepID=UPI00256FF4B0|nr:MULTISPECIES: flavodoxin domain-containing protein [unclassified Bacillus (in: firmicutes)]MDM5157268.1 hypothetical protein [Bacillus sp. DX1.1]WJE81495.1 hypothetical protein QRE67_24200 [Bacillus sp. DX3.1]